MKFTITIRAPIERVFDLIARLDRYTAWLPPSTTYAEVRDISEIPVRTGTTCTDQGQNSPMRGTVTEYAPPHRIAFRQMEADESLIVESRYTLEATSAGTLVTRDFAFHAPDELRAQLADILRAENERILAAMKARLEI